VFSNQQTNSFKLLKLFIMSENKVFTKDDLKEHVKGSTKHLGKVTLPSGLYRVSHLELKNSDIDGTNRKWADVHLVGATKSGVISGTRFASKGFSKTPVKGNTKNKYYYPSEPIDSCYEGDLADLLVEIQGKQIQIEAVTGAVPNFPLASWDTKADAEKAAVKGFSDKQFMRITKILQTTV
jgi:hypothetical protein